MRRIHGGTLTDRLRRGPLTNAALATLVGRIGGALVAGGRAGDRARSSRSATACCSTPTARPTSATSRSVRPPDATVTDDVHDLALLVERCLVERRRTGRRRRGRGMATVGRPAIARVRARRSSPRSTGTATAVDEARPNPYKGLRAFDEVDAADFFGRTDVVDELLARLRCDGLRGRLVLVVGGSGTGKSSVVRAGLLPRVRHGELPGSQQWFVTTMLPGSSPFKELAESLRRVAVAETAGLAEQLAEWSRRHRSRRCDASFPTAGNCSSSSISSRSCSPWRASRIGERSSTASCTRSRPTTAACESLRPCAPTSTTVRSPSRASARRSTRRR